MSGSPVAGRAWTTWWANVLNTGSLVSFLGLQAALGVGEDGGGVCVPWGGLEGVAGLELGAAFPPGSSVCHEAWDGTPETFQSHPHPTSWAPAGGKVGTAPFITPREGE